MDISFTLRSFFQKLKFANLNSKANKFWLIVFYVFVCLSLFFSVLLLVPSFVDVGLSNLSLILWGITFLISFFVDPKTIIFYLFNCLIILLPFLLLSLIVLFTRNNYFTTDAFRLFLISCVLISLGAFLKKHLNEAQIKFCIILYVSASFILALYILITRIIPNLDKTTSNMYLYGSKNAVFPVLASSSILCFIISKSKMHRIISLLYYLFIFSLTFITKCRTVFISLIVVSFFLLFKSKGIKVFLIVLFSFIAILITIIAVPYLNKVIIQEILFNNKTSTDDIFSGRFTFIIESLDYFTFFLGTPNYYVD